MKKVVWTFGLIAGAFLSAMMVLTLPLADTIGFDNMMVIGYTTMVLAFLFVFFGVRSYKENVGGGTVSFGRAFSVGILIVAIASVCYVVTWKIISYKAYPDFEEKYTAHVIEKERASGASEAVIQAKIAEMAEFQEMYKNPFFSFAMTFVEPFPVGLVVALIVAGIMRTRRRPT